MAKRPIHLRSADGSGLPLLLRLQRAGHPVSLWVKSPEARRVGKGMVPRAAEPPPRALVLFDTTGMGAQGAAYRKAGHLVIGGNALEKQLEMDRPAGIALMRQAGIKTPETYPFPAVPPALKFLSSQDGAWFVKVNGGDSIEANTCDAPDSETMRRYLQWVDTAGTVEPFELQRTVPGIEVSCNGWFNGHEFVPPFDITLEEKRLMNHDFGPRTGCESCVVWHATDARLAGRTVELMEDLLERHGYVGSIDLNAMIQQDGTPLGLEWTARLGFDSTQAWMRLFGGDLGEQLEAFAAGELDAWKPLAGHPFSLNARVSIPPYPTWVPLTIAKNTGLPLDDRVLDHPAFDPVDVMEGAEGPESAGASGIVGTIGMIGQDLKSMREDDILPLAHSLVIPNKQVRTHIVQRAERDLAALSTHQLAGR